MNTAAYRPAPLFGQKQPNERRAILHIGTEKTGSTSVQNLLYKNTKVLKKAGFLFPSKTCGLISNFRLLIYSRRVPDLALMRLDRCHAVSPETVAEWRAQFKSRHYKEVETFQGRRSSSTVVYSSEHFHSRLVEIDDIKALLDFLAPLYDTIKVVCYVRRQDEMVRSAHNTAVQGGLAKPLNIRSAMTTNPYYDYLGLLDRWSAVFGRDNVFARVFDRDRMLGGDVACDFAHWSGIADAVEVDTLQRELSNPRLSHFALEVLRAFNALDPSDERFVSMDKETLRQRLINDLHDVQFKDNVHVSPSRAAASEVVSFHRERNELMAQKYLGGAGFSENLSSYPLEAVSVPVVETEVEQALDTLLNGMAATRHHSLFR